ncbi:hypothetical protein [Acidisphaera sp. L21]|uniref:hypothetical protein n=1 Tax=Acidisphaera sp. L21 TaxID=1641851 RepID=UPI00131DEAE6|nr:hypothetical protein [Acidisphaera sp. L21]
MSPDEYRLSLANAAPPESGLALQSLWWVAKGEWERAHECAQQREGDPGCDWVHAHLHRVEGDQSNAGYWYRRAGRPVSTASLDQEWTEIVTALLPKG